MTTPPAPLYREIPLSQGQVALVDEWNFERLNAHKWYAMWNKGKRTFYAVRHAEVAPGKDRLVYMHREILGLVFRDPIEGDHRETKATLDNRECNLRRASDEQQQWNRGKNANNKTGFKGVSFRADRNYYVAYISINGKTKNLGHRPTARAAHEELYAQAARRIHGEYLNLT
jgi:hypothetical protein